LRRGEFVPIARFFFPSRAGGMAAESAPAAFTLREFLTALQAEGFDDLADGALPSDWAVFGRGGED
jgi:hypothetical protein